MSSKTEKTATTPMTVPQTTTSASISASSLSVTISQRTVTEAEEVSASSAYINDSYKLICNF